ncbi:Pimeloyl-ACP methyl ester carboxylesterase [Nocardia farcinica]|uniref:Haloacetate dehalogenase H-1 n=1 Tax=Nocardia farcinica TaxID=37329 RepID=A0A0H5NF16_NOCFR|nr:MULTISPECIES: alpha/beta hydrolase [Nocardia]AXK88894.1 alpha/beta hydrolase [Nocardia farcinica]MBF6185661.1 alpha/beta hydrolase [Nocardia farcinica]MBF6311506.1 alpha/beta hydrolase [Nocardia farcinica]MBF6360194.1 alpha/beta hydrolase [Nocardia farcinica]MBF6408490.1 alpha/beta hydrolase [Nocardia farcinica]
MATLTIDGVEVYYEQHGTGEEVLLVHGAAASGRWFGDLIPRLAAEYRVIVPDLRGLGRSQRVAPLERPQVWVEDMWRLLDELGLDRVHVCGVSLGSRIAGRLALDHPARVRTLTVDAPIVGLSSSGNASLNTVFTAVDPESAQAREWRELHGEDWRAAVDFYAETRRTPAFQDFYTLRPRLSEITVPTLVCRGDLDDEIHPVDDAFVWHKQAPHTQLFIAPGLTQSSVMLERAEQFVTEFVAFQQRCAVDAAA